jgi:phage tail-like protein
MSRLSSAARHAAGAAIALIAAAHAAEVPKSPVIAPIVRLDPYRTYTFRVEWDGRIIAGITRVSALTRVTPATLVTPGGGAPTKSVPGRTNFDAITLEREVTRDPAFEAWADQVYKPGSAAPSPSLLKDASIEVLDQSGRQVLLVYHLFHCWPTQYTALSGLEAGPTALPVQRLTLTCEAWDRDRIVGTGP